MDELLKQKVKKDVLDSETVRLWTSNVGENASEKANAWINVEMWMKSLRFENSSWSWMSYFPFSFFWSTGTECKHRNDETPRSHSRILPWSQRREMIWNDPKLKTVKAKVKCMNMEHEKPIDHDMKAGHPHDYAKRCAFFDWGSVHNFMAKVLWQALRWQNVRLFTCEDTSDNWILLETKRTPQAVWIELPCHVAMLEWSADDEIIAWVTERKRPKQIKLDVDAETVVTSSSELSDELDELDSSDETSASISAESPISTETLIGVPLWCTRMVWKL